MVGCLASVGGDTLCVWDEDLTSEPVYRFRHPPSRNGSCLCSCSWDWDGMAVANAISGSPSILLTTAGKDAFSSSVVNIDFTTVNDVRCVCYTNRTLKLLAVGGNDKVLMYDVARQRVQKEFQVSPNVVRCLATNNRDSRLAVGCADGVLRIFNAVSGVSGNPIVSKRLEYLVCLKYSPFRSSMLVGCSESGMVAVWDANADKMVHAFSHHKSPCTGVAFSPVQDCLLASSGLDKRCFFYDVETREKLPNIRMNDPVTSVDFLHNGFTVALATSKGTLALFDLRRCTEPMKEICSGHKSGVATVAFSASTAVSDGSGVSACNKRGKFDFEAFVPHDEARESVAIDDGERRDSLFSMFSPVQAPWNLSLSMESSFGTPLRGINVKLPTVGMDSLDSVFSPLQEQSFNTFNISSNQCRKPSSLTGPAASLFNSPLAVIKEENPAPSPTKPPFQLSRSPDLNIIRAPVAHIIDRLEASTASRDDEEPKPGGASAGNNQEEAKPGAATTAPEHQFDSEHLVRLWDGMDDFITDVKRHLWHIEWEMAKNFQDLQDRMELLLLEVDELRKS